MGKKITSRLLPLFGFLFLTAYIRSAAVNVVYTDYIRLVNTYLENVFSFAPYLRGDILTRIPINYPERILNVVLFRYSTMFDMVLGALFLSVTAGLIASYCANRNLPWIGTAVLLLIIFSLNKWEMLTNGSGWVHFAAFALFTRHELVYDRAAAGDGKKGDRKRLLILPWIVILLFAGPYCAVYAVTLICADLFLLAVRKVKREEALPRMLCMLLPLLLYILSRSFAVEDRAGATTESVFTVLGRQPLLFPSLFVRSFSSMIIGGETASAYGIAKPLTIAAGLLVLACYGWAFYLNIAKKLYERSIFPLIMLFSGLLNHVLITCSRWIFLNDSYGMSSRYALQFQVGIIGLLLTFYMAEQQEKRAAGKAAVLLISAVFLTGNLITTGHEIHMAPYRQENFAEIREAALHFETLPDEELSRIFEYHDGAKTRQALTLLKERRLNVFQ